LALNVSLCWGVNASTNFGGTAPLKIWEGKKRLKIGAIYDFRVWAQPDGTDGAINSLNAVDESDPFGVEQKKFVKFRPPRTKL